MKRPTVKTIKSALKIAAYAIGGAVVVILIVAIKYLNGRPDLNVWHEVRFEQEFKKSGKVKTFNQYLELEDRLFKELDEKVYNQVKPNQKHEINRFHRDSLADPGRWDVNWNRTFVMPAENPKAGILLLHGMSDSPYSLRTIGKQFHDRGASVIGLRIPGHGTAPSGLVTVTWEDMAAAVRLAMIHLHEQVGDQPLYIVGYSNGAALGVEYVLSSLEGEKLPELKGLILISPSIGVTSMARFAVWQGRLGWLLGLKKLAWSSVLFEYDPFKYNSFAINAGDQVHRITAEIRSRLPSALSKSDGKSFPPVLAFQSAVDATVSTEALVRTLFYGLPEGGHELVLFDINRITQIKEVLLSDPMIHIESMLKDGDLPFALTVLTNKGSDSRQVHLIQSRPGLSEEIEKKSDMIWPTETYSLSHVALPFREDDPLYGASPADNDLGIHLGAMALRGERGVLWISAAEMLRFRWNPFYSYIEERSMEFIGFSENLN